MKFVLKIGHSTKLVFATLKEATKALEALQAGVYVDETHCSVNGRYSSVYFIAKDRELQLVSIDDDKLRAIEPKVDDDGNEIGTPDAVVLKRAPRRRGLLLGNGS